MEARREFATFVPQRASPSLALGQRRLAFVMAIGLGNAIVNERLRPAVDGYRSI